MLVIIEILFEALRLATFQPGRQRGQHTPADGSVRGTLGCGSQGRFQTDVPAARS
jgi:hypothetical protein